MKENNRVEKKLQKMKLLNALLDKENRNGSSRKFFKATGERIKFMSKQLLDAYNPKLFVAMRGLLMPPEILYATEFVPFTPEIICALMAGRNQKLVQLAIQSAEGIAIETKTCSFIKASTGSDKLGFFPIPDIVISSSSYCSEMSAVLKEIAIAHNSPFFHLDVPLEITSASVIFVAQQLKELVKLLCEIRGINIDEVENEKLPNVIKLSTQAGEYWRKIQELRKVIPAPWSAMESFHFSSVLSQAWGSEKIVEIYKLLYKELRIRVKNNIGAIEKEEMRLLALHFGPYHSNDTLELIEKLRVVIAFEEVSYPNRSKLNPNNPYESLALQIIKDGNYRDGTTRGNDLVKLVKGYRIDGIIYFGQENCEWNKATFHVAKRILEEKTNIPILHLSSDCLIKTRTSHLKMRVQAFIEAFLMRGLFSHPIECGETKICYIGIDVGSTTIKTVIINRNRTVAGYDVSLVQGNTAKDSLTRALKNAKLSLENCSKEIVVTGIGRENLDFLPKYIDVIDVTEITCHLLGATILYSDVELVIDIGGQDMKVISRNGYFAINNSCSAGSGKFLEKMADILNINVQELGRLDTLSTKSIIISNMCTVFAETDIVGLLASGNKVEDVAHAVNEMIARWAVSLSAKFRCKAKLSVVMTGGVALNSGVVKNVETMLNVKIHVPKTPQIVGAYGAANIALYYFNLKSKNNERIAELASV